MTRPERPVRYRELRQRQNHARRDDRVPLDQHRAIVQRRVRREDAHHQIRAHLRLQARARLRVFVQPHVPLDRDDRPDLRARQPVHRFHQLLHHLPALQPVEHPDHPGLTQPRQRAPQLRLEHDQRRDRADLEQHLQDVLDQLEVQEARHEVHAREQQQADQHLDRARAREEPQHVIQHDRHDDDLDQVQNPR